MAKSKWKPLISQFLKDRGTPATLAYIADHFGRPQGDSNIARALKILTAEGKLIRTKRKGLRDKPVWYEWNKDWKLWYVGDSMDTTRAIREGQYDGIAPGMENPQSKFTVGSEWRTRNGMKAVVRSVIGDAIISVDCESDTHHYSTFFNTDGTCCLQDKKGDSLACHQRQ